MFTHANLNCTLTYWRFYFILFLSKVYLFKSISRIYSIQYVEWKLWNKYMGNVSILNSDMRIQFSFIFKKWVRINILLPQFLGIYVSDLWELSHVLKISSFISLKLGSLMLQLAATFSQALSRLHLTQSIHFVLQYSTNIIPQTTAINTQWVLLTSLEQIG